MPDPSSFTLFLGAALVLLVIPGPAVLYIVGRSIEQGRTAGLMSVAGVALGGLFTSSVLRSGCRCCSPRPRSRSTSSSTPAPPT